MLSRLMVGVISLATAAVVAGCAPSIYKEEVLVFKRSSDKAVEAFDGLRTDKTLLGLLDASVEKQKIDTTGACGNIVEEQLQRYAACLGEWARYRAESGGQPRRPPTCPEPTGFYVLPLGQEREACRLGTVTTNASGRDIVDPMQLPSSRLLPETQAIGAKLRDYAAALTEIATSNDGETLQSAVGKAKATVESLAHRIQQSAKSDVKLEAIGPVSDLIGTSLVLALEHRRYDAMKHVVERADPVVAQAAQMLSRASVVLLIPRLRDAANDVNDAIQAVNLASEKEFATRLGKARAAVDDYLELYQADPAASFQAMATAHHALKEALGDPKRAVEALMTATADFAEKAKAAYKVFAKPKEKKEKSDG